LTVHELSLVEAVIEAVTERFGDRPVASIRLEIGELSGVVPDAIAFCFDVAAAGTSIEGVSVEIVTIPALCRCRTCGAEFRPDDHILLCACGSADVGVVAGDQMRIASVGVASGGVAGYV
jgi:hydrogenase nickel incorporation protein HypA/HybF